MGMELLQPIRGDLEEVQLLLRMESLQVVECGSVPVVGMDAPLLEHAVGIFLEAPEHVPHFGLLLSLLVEEVFEQGPLEPVLQFGGDGLCLLEVVVQFSVPGLQVVVRG